MDDILLPDNKLYLAENCVRSFTTPTFTPSVIYSVIGGVLTFAIFEKYIRKGYFLPYIYFGTTALLYSFAHIFLIIFVEEEHLVVQNIDDYQDITHENALYGSLIIAAFGSYFALLALFRLLEVWVRVGLKINLHLSKYYLGVLTALLSAIPLIFSVAGDILLISESGKDEEMTKEVRKALIVKLIGASCNVILVLFFIILCISYAWSAYTSNVSETKSTQLRSSISTSVEVQNPIEKNFQNAAIMLIALGLLALLRFIYDLYIVIVVIRMGPFWDIPAYLVLVVIDGIALLSVAYLSNISRVKDLMVYTKMTPNISNIEKSNNTATQNVEEVIPFSRSPIHIEEDHLKTPR